MFKHDKKELSSTLAVVQIYIPACIDNCKFRQRHWRFRIEEALCCYSDVGIKYEMVAEERLVGMYIIVYDAVFYRRDQTSVQNLTP